VYVGLSKSQHNMTVRSVYLLNNIGSRIVTTQCKRIVEKRLMNEISSRVIYIIVFVYIALKSLLISICAIVPDPGASADILQHHGRNYLRLFPLKIKVERT
jgi:hypothetical protein